MEKKIKMLVIPSDHGGCGFFRSTQPHVYIAENYGDLFDIDIMYNFPQDVPLDKFLSQYQIVHIHKQLDNNCELINMMKFLGIKVIVDIDDHWDLGNDHPMSIAAKKEKWAEPIINHLKLADAVSTTTPIFAKEIRKYNKNVWVLPNAINPNEEQYIPKPTKSDRIRFGLICGSSHLEDLKLMKGMTNSLPKEVLDKIQFVLCGFDTNGTKTIYHQDTGEVEKRDIYPEESVWYDYEKIITNNYSIVKPEHKDFLLKFVKGVEYPDITDGYRRCWTKDIKEYATHYNTIDVLLVPLKENTFNSVKSQLKVIEAGFFHKAIIAQNFGPYTIDLKPMIEKGGKINEEGNALLVDSRQNHKMWAKYITKLVKEPELITKLQENLYETVKDTYSIDAVCKTRVEKYKTLLEE